jgi:hypothetical protein
MFQHALPASTRRPPYWGFGAQGAAGDPEPRAFWGFGAQGAAGDPEPRALKSTVVRRKAPGDAA